jgi:hypothetical protein
VTVATTEQRANHSGFAQFANEKRRDRFVRTVLDTDPSLKDRAYVAGSRPTIVFDNLTAEQLKKVISALKGLGRWFEDTQFQTTG